MIDASSPRSSPNESSNAARGSLELAVFLPQETLVFALPALGRVLVGRAPECDVRIDDPSVSRRHAVVILDAEPCIEDLASANGTQVRRVSMVDNGDTEETAHGRGGSFGVNVGDTILFGSVRACLRHSKSEEDRGARDMRGMPVMSDPAMRAVYDEARRAAQGDMPILLLGETGVGKEVLARYIHQVSKRARGPFVVVHVAALGTSLLEAELFGHEKGAFTGATEARPGLFESASTGTVLLDEIAEIPLALQVKLLRVIEERAVLRVGARKPRPVDVRFLAATHRDLKAEVRASTFREDLYYRLDGLSLTIPPLRERPSDVRPLAQALFLASCKKLDRLDVPTLPEEILRLLETYSWPGNVRELRNMMDRAAALGEGAAVLREHLSPSLLAAASVVSHVALPPSEPPISTVEPVPTIPIDAFRSAVEELDRRRILDALNACGGNQSRAAEMLGMSRRTLSSRLDAYGLPRPRKGT